MKGKKKPNKPWTSKGSSSNSSAFYTLCMSSHKRVHVNLSTDFDCQFQLVLAGTFYRRQMHFIISLIWPLTLQASKPFTATRVKVQCVIFGDFNKKKQQHQVVGVLGCNALSLKSPVPSLSRTCQRTRVACEHKPGYLIQPLLRWYICGRQRSA